MDGGLRVGASLGRRRTGKEVKKRNTLLVELWDTLSLAKAK